MQYTGTGDLGVLPTQETLPMNHGHGMTLTDDYVEHAWTQHFSINRVGEDSRLEVHGSNPCWAGI